jgi:cell division protease FtsH
MEAINSDLKEVFISKQEILDNAKKVLKQEFIGIDKIIDEIIDNVSSWFFLPDLQEKPVVVNLWGLTGVGKTSLVNRLAELIYFEDRYYRFDLGEKDGSLSFRDSLDSLFENKDSSPVIIALDEIQHSRTISGPLGQEVDSDKNRMIWELIDSGKIQYLDWQPGLWSLEEDVVKLTHLLKRGIRVSNGLVKSHIDLYINEMGIRKEENEALCFVPQYIYRYVFDFAGEELGFKLQIDVENYIKSLSAEESIQFLKRVIKIAKSPTVKNFSKALIFVMGNLDEAYSMSNNFSSDIDADEFNKLSQKITVPKIKRALQNRFRNEQIARLGNIHIIYPALDKMSYQKIIENELTKYSQNLTKAFNLKIEFDSTIHEIIYNEGVYPTQGVRPIFTSIHQVLKSKISFFYSKIFLKTLEVDSLHFSVSNKCLICDYLKKQKTVYTSHTEITTTLENVRQSKRDDLQAITAVHESGHTVLSIILLKTIPDVVYSITTDEDSQGFVYSSFAWKYISRKELIPRVAMMLGGYVAEELVFGKENLTSGASSDIEKATEFLSSMYKTNGMGQTPIKYSIPIKEENDSYHQFGAIEEEIKNAIEEAKLLAEKTLKSEQKLLLSLSDFLSDNRMLRKNDIKRLVEKAISSNVDFTEDGDYLFYRNHLKKQIKDFQVSKPSELHFENVISLNLNKSYKE